MPELKERIAAVRLDPALDIGLPDQEWADAFGIADQTTAFAEQVRRALQYFSVQRPSRSAWLHLLKTAAQDFAAKEGTDRAFVSYNAAAVAGVLAGYRLVQDGGVYRLRKPSVRKRSKQ